MAKEAGVLMIIDPGSDKLIAEVATLQCVHCGCHWVPQPGSGKVRGGCTHCKGPICGPACAICVPYEQMIENIEANRPLDYQPTRIFIPRWIG